MPRAYVFRDGDEVIGTVSATYDLSDCPANLHSMMLGIIQNNTMVVHCGGVLHPDPPREKTPVAPTWWDKVKGWMVSK